MQQPTAERRIVKSPPELWAELSDEDALARHLEQFGEIRITRVEPETTVAWEGDRASGTVELAPAGWGTKVTLTAALPEAQEAPPAAEEPDAPAERPSPVIALRPAPQSYRPADATPPSPAAEPRPSLLARLFGRHAELPAPTTPDPAPQPPPAATKPRPPAPGPEPTPPDPDPAPTVAQPERLDGERTAEILAGVLDDLGAAHHRPFSRG